MKPVHFVSISILGVATAARDSCTPGNNCQRALLRTIAGQREPLSDCNSYFRVTVTPATVVDTTTTTSVVVTTQTNIVLTKRQATVSASNIPAYASACTAAAEYSFACSCIGATPSTITVAAPHTRTTTLTTTTSTATTVVDVPYCTSSNYISREFLFERTPQSEWKVTTVPDSASFTPDDCCKACTSTLGCMNWSLQSYGCDVYYEPGATAANECPYGRLTVGYSTGSFAIIGPGPCGNLVLQ